MYSKCIYYILYSTSSVDRSVKVVVTRTGNFTCELNIGKNNDTHP